MTIDARTVLRGTDLPGARWLISWRRNLAASIRARLKLRAK